MGTGGDGAAAPANGTAPAHLTADEQARLDALLSAARAFNYSAFVVAGIAMMLTAIPAQSDVTVPLVSLKLQTIEARVAAFLVTLAFTKAALSNLAMANPWMVLDRRRPPFAWPAVVPKSDGSGDGRRLFLWLGGPVLVSGAVAGAPGGVWGLLSVVWIAGTVVGFEGALDRFTQQLSGKDDEPGPGPPLAPSALRLAAVARFGSWLVACGVLFAQVPRWERLTKQITGMAGLASCALTFLVLIVALTAGAKSSLFSLGRRALVMFGGVALIVAAPWSILPLAVALVRRRTSAGGEA